MSMKYVFSALVPFVITVFSISSSKGASVDNVPEFTLIPLGNFSRLDANAIRTVREVREEIYWFTTSIRLTANQGNKICESTNGFISASIEDVETNTKLSEFLASQQIHSVWTSGGDFEQNGKFIWRGNSHPFTYTNWYELNPLFPNPNCQCVAVESRRTEGCAGSDDGCMGEYKWHELPCHEKKRLLCQLQ